MSEREAQGPYPYPVPGPSQAYSPYPPWYPPDVYYSRVWGIVSCMLTKLNNALTLAQPGAWEEAYTALADLGATEGIATVRIEYVPPEKFERLVQEHRDLYEQCACELYPGDRALCKKERW
jgi:hypothetical protein